MRRYGRMILGVLAITGGLVFFAAQTSAGSKPQYLIVKLNPAYGDPRSLLERTLNAQRSSAGVTKIKTLPIHDPALCASSGPIFRLTVTDPRQMDRLLQSFSSQPFVDYAEPDAEVHAFLTPNDPNYANQWHFQKIGIENAWDYDTTAPLYGGDPGIVVAVVDTGVAYENFSKDGDTFAQGPDFAATNFVSGYDFVNDDTHPNDDNGHGTHVAGTIAENTNNSLLGAGVAFQTSIMPIKVLDRSGTGLMSDVASAIDFAVTNGAEVINLSLGSTLTSQTVHDAIDRALAAGIVVVAAAGNDTRGSLSYPALFSGVISVSALGRDDVLASYSNYGPGLSLSAPGGDDGEYVWQQGYNNLDAENLPVDYTHFGLVGFQGTSQAAPQVSGAAALLLAKGVPGANIKSLLEATATDLGDTGYDIQYGNGRLNVANAFFAFLNDTTAPVTAAVVSPAAPDGQGGYYRTLPQITLSASDGTGGSGVARTNYSWDAGTTTTYTVPIEPPQGTHTLTYASVDPAGNQESAKTLTMTVDSIGPALTIHTPGTTTNNPLVHISGTVADATSGLASLTIDGVPTTVTSSGTFSLSKRLPVGSNTLIFLATDNAGATTTVAHPLTVTSKARIIIGAGPGGGPQVFITANSGRKITSFFGYAKTFRGGVNVASGDINGDGTAEVVVAPGPGSPPAIRIFTNHAKLIRQFLAFPQTFRGGVNVTTADINNDGKSEIIAVPESASSSQVKIFTEKGKLLRQFTAFPKSFLGGASIAGGDINGDGTTELIVGAGTGGGPQVRVFRTNGKLLKQFYAYATGFRGGVRVASGDVNADGSDDILVAPGPGGGPQVRIFRGSGRLLRQFSVFAKTEKGGVFISAADVNGDGKTEVVVGSGTNSPSQVRVLTATGKVLQQFRPFPQTFRGGITIATGFTD